MTRLNVNPTRMELKKLKARLATAVRGHKLLKDKSDEMVRRFTEIVKKNMKLRREADRMITETLRSFSVARSLIPVHEAETAFSMPAAPVTAECGIATIMGVEVPEIKIEAGGRTGGLPYAYPEITSEADASVKRAGEILPVMIELAVAEKTMRMLATEIERNKRRVNALEYVMIPQLEETIAYIKDKLDENERAAVVRLMKVKGKAAE